MKKGILPILATLLIAALVAGVFGLRYSRRQLSFKFRSPASACLPGITWLDAVPADEKGFLLFDLHRVDDYPVEVGFPAFTTTAGWSNRGETGTWAIGPKAVLDFRMDTVRPRSLILNTNPTKGLFERTQHATVLLNGHRLGRVRFSDANPLSTLRMPAETQMEGLNRLVFNFDYTVRPVDRGRGDDERPLAAWFRNITILDGSFGNIVASVRTVRIFRDLIEREKRSLVFIDSKQRLVIRKSGTIVTAVNPEGRKQLNLEIYPATSAGSLNVTAHGLAGQAVPANLVIEPVGGAANATIRLPDHFDTAFLEIEVQADTDSTLRLAAPWLTSLNPPSMDERELTDTAETRPVNLVVLILDAARPDRFGCYGGDRPTTPYIDALAAESVVFPDVVALAPYTLCSVPIMATGLSFLDHGVVKREQRLSVASTTLAEVLTEAGYRTAAFSATPNNSKKLGLAQGYQIFGEAWKGV
ncbi:MAG: sulfatase-like hydrolase/transferase, partial [Thermoanaerobaculales bacterium]|nr:sulfatase-like hydrolase/transferase [Thermoanaerobaculales bacterium]